MTEEQKIINKLKRVWDNCLNTELRNTIDDTVNCIEKLQEEIATLKHNKKTVAHLSSCISDVQEKKIAELELEIKKLTQHLEPQLMTDLLKQVREEVEQEQRITELEAQIEKMKCLLNEIYSEYGFSELVQIRNNLPIEIQEVIKEIKEK